MQLSSSFLRLIHFFFVNKVIKVFEAITFFILEITLFFILEITLFFTLEITLFFIIVIILFLIVIDLCTILLFDFLFRIDCIEGLIILIHHELGRIVESFNVL